MPGPIMIHGTERVVGAANAPPLRWWMGRRTSGGVVVVVDGRSHGAQVSSRYPVATPRGGAVGGDAVAGGVVNSTTENATWTCFFKEGGGETHTIHNENLCHCMWFYLHSFCNVYTAHNTPPTNSLHKHPATHTKTH